MKRRLAAVFCAVAALLIASGVLYHRHYQNALRSDAERLLLSIEQIKIHQLQLWREERANTVLSLLDGQSMLSHLKTFVADPGENAVAAALRSRLRTFIARQRYQYAALAGSDGRVLLHTGGKPEKMCQQVNSLISRAGISRRPELGDFYLHPGEASPHIDMVVPAAKGRGGGEIFLLLRIDPMQFLYPLLQTWSGKGQTGEILLVGRDGNELVFLNDLRHVENAAMRLRLPLNSETLPAAMGLRGKTGLVEGLDYRGVPVLAAVGPVPDTNWALVTKMDRDEVLKGAGTLAVLLSLLVLALLAAAGAAAYLLLRRQAAAYESERRRAEEKLRSSNERFTLAARAAGIGVWDWDVESNTLVWDDRMFELYGVKREDFPVAYDAWLKGLHPEDRARCERESELALKGEKAYDTEFRVLLPDGTVRYLKAIADVFRGPAGRPLRMVGVNQDITDSRLAAQRLQESEERLRVALDETGIGVWEWNVEEDLWRASPTYYTMLGYQPETGPADRKVWLERVHPEDRDGVAAKIRGVLDGSGAKYQYEARIRHADGSYRWHLVLGTEVKRGADGKPARLIGVRIDVTERRRNEEINAARLRLLQYAATHTQDELLEQTLNEAEKLTESRIGFYHSVNEDQRTLTLQNWSTATKARFCKAEGKGRHYDVDKAGVWAECFYRREPVIHNDYASLPGKKGMPEGHAAVTRELVVPVLRGEKVLAILGVGNKPVDYTQDDVAAVSLLADLAWDITERKLAEEALRKSEKALKEAQRLARLGNWTLDLSTNRLEWSEEIFRIFEVDPSRFGASYEAFLEVIHPEDREAVNKAYTESLKNRTPYDIVHRLLMPDGRVKYVSEFCETFYDAEGRPQRSVGTVQDITDRRRAEQELHTLSQQRELALSAARLGWWTYDPVSKIASYDARYKEIFEVTGSSQPNKEILKRLHPEDLPGVWAKVEAALDPADPRPYSAEYRVVIPDGPVKWVEAHGLAIFEGEGEARRAVNFVGTVADITERRNAEEKLRQSETAVRSKLQALLSPEGELETLELGDILDVAELQAIMDEFYALTKIGIGIIDMKGKVLVGTGWQEICTRFHRVNAETARNCLESDTELSEGVERGKCKSYLCKNNLRDIATPIIVAGKHLGNLFLGQFLYTDEPYAPEVFRRQARRYGFDERAYMAAYEKLPRFSREQVDTVMRFYARFSELISTLSYGKIKLARALAQSRQAELEKEHLNKALAAKNKEMENFLYITTHDLRSPLVNIQGFSQNLQRDLAEIRAALAEAGLSEERKARTRKISEEKVPEALGFVLESTAKMDALLSALLKVSRLGRQELKPETLEMGPALTRIVDTMLFQVREAGAVINIGPLPSCRADAASVSQLFSNLLDNAVKYRDPARKLVVEISGVTRGGMAVYRVADNGPGIPPAEQERLWDIFYKPAAAGKKNGEGIGLPMCRRIAERNGGGISVEPAPGGGSVFVVELPAA